MTDKTPLNKGYTLEESLRAYFLQAGFFVLRGVPFQSSGVDLTDIDLWLYDKPTGTARRQQILDAKFKNKPKAVERLFWTKGLAEALNADGAYVATTDERKILRTIAQKLDISLLDGTDLKRISESEKATISDRLLEEEFLDRIKTIDQSRHTKELQETLTDLKGSITEGLGASSLVRSLEAFQLFTNLSTSSPPRSRTALVAGRLSYLSAAIISLNLDYISIESPFRTVEERKEKFSNAVRYGHTEKTIGITPLRIALDLVRGFADNGTALAHTIDKAVSSHFNSIPAEIIAEQAARMSGDGSLFTVAKLLEHAAFSRVVPSFDDLDPKAKALLGVFLDFCRIDRPKFAQAWESQEEQLQLQQRRLPLGQTGGAP